MQVILHVLEHVRAVLDDGLQDLLVALHAAADLGQLTQEAGEELLMAAGEAEELPLAPLQPLINVGPGSERDRIHKVCRYKQMISNKSNVMWTDGQGGVRVTPSDRFLKNGTTGMVSFLSADHMHSLPITTVTSLFFPPFSENNN